MTVYRERQPQVEAKKFDGTPESAMEIMVWLENLRTLNFVEIFFMPALEKTFPQIVGIGGQSIKVLQVAQMVINQRKSTGELIVTKIWKNMMVVLMGDHIESWYVKDFNDKYEETEA